MSKFIRSQNQIIKAHLLQGEPITTWQAIQLYKITCLTTRISNLRKTGLSITQKSVTNDNGKRYNIYWLDSDYIEAFKAKRGNYE